MKVCPICLANLNTNTCNNCILNIQKCILCFQKLEIGDEVLQCKECLNIGHIDQFKGWLRIKKVCPICREEYHKSKFQSLLIEKETVAVNYKQRLDLFGIREKIFDEFSFKLQFYDFQSKLVKSLSNALTRKNRHLLISPPGSGKTIIALAVARSIGKHTLILTPNLAVLGSWIDRSHMFFEGNKSLKVSDVINKERGGLRPLSITTYQKINQEIKNNNKLIDNKKHSKSKSGNSNIKSKNVKSKIDNLNIDIVDPMNFIDRLIEYRVEFIILDEAHRLTGTWGENILELISLLTDVKVLGLTATPPAKNDETFDELFENNITFIPLPQLVRERILSPYRDLAVSIPDPNDIQKEIEKLETSYSDELNELVDIKNKKSTRKELEQIINKKGKETISYLLKIRGLKEFEYIKRIQKEFGTYYQEKEVADAYWLSRNNSFRLLTTIEIIKHEYSLEKDKLRILLITDNENVSSNLSHSFRGVGGAIGIFEVCVLDEIVDELQPVMVTGKSILVDDDFTDEFLKVGKKWIRENNYDITMKMTRTPKKYSIINGSGKDWSTDTYTRFITYLFDNGITKLLVGTRHLFGEGWDSINLNTIIDLTTISAFTSVNQIRGRALRQSLDYNNKVSHIYDFIPNPKFSGEFFDRELKSFKLEYEKYFGIDNKGHIRNGINRLNPNIFEVYEVKLPKYDKINQYAFRISNDKKSTFSTWKVGEELGNLHSTIVFTFTGAYSQIMIYEYSKGLKIIFDRISESIGAGPVVVRTDFTEDTLTITIILEDTFPVDEIYEQITNINSNSGYLLTFNYQPPSEMIYDKRWIYSTPMINLQLFVPFDIDKDEQIEIGRYSALFSTTNIKAMNTDINNNDIKIQLEYEYINEDTIIKYRSDILNSEEFNSEVFSQLNDELIKNYKNILIKNFRKEFEINYSVINSSNNGLIADKRTLYVIHPIKELFKIISDTKIDVLVSIYHINSKYKHPKLICDDISINSVFPICDFNQIKLIVPHKDELSDIMTSFYHDGERTKYCYLIMRRTFLAEIKYNIIRAIKEMFNSEYIFKPSREWYVIKTTNNYDIDDIELIGRKMSYSIYIINTEFLEELLSRQNIYPIVELELETLKILNTRVAF